MVQWLCSFARRRFGVRGLLFNPRPGLSGRAGGILMVALAGLAQTTSPFTRAARADIDPVSGIDFVRIGAVGNAPWPGNGQPVDRAVGRGGVDYEYSIGRFEVTTAQWVEF
ncbi:MAG: hypothetical protein ACK4WH_13975, partial [Phycisphaerales bacterium]